MNEAGRRVIFDAEHFFDGYKDDTRFAIKMLRAAEKAGASDLVLCDTNGGTLPNEIFDIVSDVKTKLIFQLEFMPIMIAMLELLIL